MGSPVTYISCVPTVLGSWVAGERGCVVAELNASRETMWIVESWSMLGKEWVKGFEGFFLVSGKKSNFREGSNRVFKSARYRKCFYLSRGRNARSCFAAGRFRSRIGRSEM